MKPTDSLVCYSSYFDEQYEICGASDFCFLLEDYSLETPSETRDHQRSCERRGYCKTLIENLKGKFLNKYGLRHKCGTFMVNDTTYTDLCCCSYDWCNKLKINELPIAVDRGKGRELEISLKG
ncbi:unnamed protein product [Thelazia callipaeda]|uniref:Activin_recp domain-containing protein n=1 Tax=Thelazia callipaeda TaxID=103827 RepID=A0A0N5CLX0_THECL|nr:unnamed protein product [Thelazia callipaeda]